MLVGVVVGCFHATPRAGGEHDTSTRTKTQSDLAVHLAVSPDLPALSRMILVREADAIWRDARVQLQWLDGDAGPQPGRQLRVVVTERTITSAASGHRWGVGELLRFKDDGAIAIASISSAERIVDESQAFQRLDVPVMRHYRVGVVLGRAVAHEIGHYLLQSNAHSTSGLMRARIDAREFADLRTGTTFRLDRESQASLATSRSTTN